MIQGANTTFGLTSEEFEVFAEHLDGPSSTQEVISNLVARKQNLLNGGVNCIPLPFARFRGEVPGIEQGQYVVVTANQKVSLT